MDKLTKSEELEPTNLKKITKTLEDTGDAFIAAENKLDSQSDFEEISTGIFSNSLLALSYFYDCEKASAFSEGEEEIKDRKCYEYEKTASQETDSYDSFELIDYPNISKNNLCEDAKTMFLNLNPSSFKNRKNIQRKSIAAFLGRSFQSLGDGKSAKQRNYHCQCKKVKKIGYCIKVHEWLEAIRIRKEKVLNLKHAEQLYEEYTKGNSKFNKQIKSDVLRTFQNCPLFSSKCHGREQLEKTLQVISKYDKTIGYVQGMNFIVASLLYHTHSEPIAFWIFVRLLEDYEIRDILVDRLPGLYKHIGILDGLIKCFCPEAHQHMTENGISIQIFVTDWIMTLFTNTIPFSISHRFIQAFLAHGGWLFFYKFGIRIFQKLTPQILKNNFSDYMLNIEELDVCTGFAFKSEKSRKKGIWRKLIKSAESIKFNEQYIRELMGKFDYENLKFTVDIKTISFKECFVKRACISAEISSTPINTA